MIYQPSKLKLLSPLNKKYLRLKPKLSYHTTMKILHLFLITLGMVVAAQANAVVFPLPHKNNDVVGKLQTITVPKDVNITDLGEKYSVGYLEFLESNPLVDIQNLWSGERLVLPTKYILPPAPRRGIVINLAELRMYYYPKKSDAVYIFPIGIGRSHTPTPLMKSKIIAKHKDPTWIPTEDTHEEARELGIMLPERILPGPQNPLGKYSIRLSHYTYLIHGTNRPEGVGMKSSGGCIRMYPDDVEQLFHLVHVGTPVDIIDQPFKIGWKNNVLYLESHVPVELKRKKAKDQLEPLIDVLKDKIYMQHAKIDWQRAIKVAEQQTGIPEPIGRRYSSNSHPASGELHKLNKVGM
jgi:L,D-transpeptidase ErfK/SrfK